MANTKVLLTESVKHVGKVGDVVEVSPGFARNYLLPQNLAVMPTAGNMKKIEARRQEVEKQEREKRSQLETLIKTLTGVEITIERKANEQGHLFGSVSATDISKALQAQGFNIQPDDVNLPGKVDRIDTFTIRIKLAEDLGEDVKLWVSPDAESKALIDSARKVAAKAEAEAAAAEAEAAKAEKAEKSEKGEKKEKK
jgi:large subunit ribosomal protein L9